MTSLSAFGAGAIAFGAGPRAQAPAAPAVARGTILTVSTWGGITEDGVRKFIQPEFERATGAKLAFDIGGQGGRFNKLLAQRTRPPADVFFSTDEAVVAGHRQGVLQAADRKNIPNLADLHAWAMTVHESETATAVPGVPYALLSMVISYNPQLVAQKPVGWADLWRPEFRDRLVMPSPQTSLMPEWLTIANDLSGGTQADYSPGFRKLSELKPVKASMFWTDWAPLNKTGEVVIAPEFDYYIETMKSQGYAIDYVVPAEKGIAAPEYISVVKNAPNPALAEYFMNLSLEPKVQSSFAVETFQGPTNKKVVLDAGAAARCAYGERIGKLRFFDTALFVDARPRLTEQFNMEVLPKWQR